MKELLYSIYSLALDASFWLVIGLLIGGVFKTLIPTEFLHKHLSQPGFSSIIKAAILGAPLPLCSCGVIPAAMGLREAGASKSATTSFLVSTPETGVDSVFITYAMMGPFMAISRPIIALFSAITTGTLVNLFDTEHDEVDKKEIETSCCSSKNKSQEKIQSTETDSCCGKEEVKTENYLSKTFSGVKYAFTNLLDEIIFWLAIGLLFAAIVQTFVPSDMLIKYGTGWTGMLVMLLVGIPMYVCATASTPIAAGFLMAGISPGAVIVFLVAGPATNMATLGIINQQMGKRTMLLYLLGIMSTSLLSGFVVNWLVSANDINITEHLKAHTGLIPFWLQMISLLVLLALSLRKWLPKNAPLNLKLKDSI
jgi:uncharacterized membrane protein YraQ (UPF0718 family)